MLDRGNVNVHLRSASPAPTTATVPVEGARASHRALDWFVFFLADIQTGFGPFVAIYLTSQHWTQVDIGFILTAGGLVALASQIPAGAVVDAVRSVRSLAAVSVLAIGASALALSLWPVFLVVLAARALHAAASCVLGPIIAAISVGLAGHKGLGERLGRNARFASIGNGAAAAAMGVCGYVFSSQAVFFLTAALVIPALLALRGIRQSDIEPLNPAPGGSGLVPSQPIRVRTLVRDRRLLILIGCVLLFHLANAAMLPLLGSMLAMRASDTAAALIGACIVVPQILVAIFSPRVGRAADGWGRRPLLFLCFAALALRGVLLALVSGPYLVIAVQALDGVSAAILAVTLPLVVADITRGTGRFNLALGVVGSAVGIGAALSTTIAGFTADHFGSHIAFVSLAGIALCGLGLAWFLPETRPAEAIRTVHAIA